MDSKPATSKAARIERFLKRQLANAPWSVDEAKAKLTKIMSMASSGEPQIVGIRKPVLMVGADKIEELADMLSQPETWGEYFATPHDGEDSDVALTMKSSGGRARFNFDVDESSSESMKTGVVHANYQDLPVRRDFRGPFVDPDLLDAAAAAVKQNRFRRTHEIVDRTRLDKSAMKYAHALAYEKLPDGRVGYVIGDVKKGVKRKVVNTLADAIVRRSKQLPASKFERSGEGRVLGKTLSSYLSENKSS